MVDLMLQKCICTGSSFQNDFHIGILKSASINHIEIRTNGYIDTISS